MQKPEKSSMEGVLYPESASKANKGELRKVDQDLLTAKNRLATLKQQLQREKQSVKKNKSLTQQVIAKKLIVSSINNFKQKDNSEDLQRIEILKKRNLSMRIEHEKSLQNIQKAIYLVKLDDAREAKNISSQHKKKIREMESHQFSKKIERKKQFKEESSKAKERYMKYWKEKLTMIYAMQAHSAQELEKSKQQKQREIKLLEEQEIQLLEEINTYHGKVIQSKKQYVAALSLPAKQVVLAMMSHNLNDPEEGKKSMQNSRSKSLAGMDSRINRNKSLNIQQANSLSSLPNLGQKIKVPHTLNVNQTKLKIILQQLKRIQKKKQRYEGEQTQAT